MSPEALAKRLRPIEDWRADGAAGRSDFDLNPGVAMPDAAPTQAAVLVALTPAAGGVHVILTRRADTLTRHTGQIAFPGGRLDEGETAPQAALREAWEEIGLPQHGVRVLGLGDAYRTVTGFVVTPVVGWVDRTPRLTPAPMEVAEIFLTPWSHLMDPANHRRDHHDVDGLRRHFWSIAWQDRVIWGATAGMLLGLRERLGGSLADVAA